MKKIRFNQIIIFLSYLLFFFLLLKNSFHYLDPDFGWHLKAGEEVHINKKVPYENLYNYVFEEGDNYWVNHEWLSDYLLFLGYENFGYIFLNIIFALIIISTLIIVNKFIIKNIAPDKNFIYILLILELFGLKAMLPHLGIRIQELSILFLLLILIIIYLFEKRALSDNINKKRTLYKPLIFLIPLIYLWANLHGGWLLGIFILFFYFGIKLVEKIILNYKGFFYKIFGSFLNFNNPLKNKDLGLFFLFSVIASLSTTLTPYGLKLFDFLSSYKNTAYLKIISEWLPQYYFPYLYWQLFYIGLIVAIIIIAIINKNRPAYKILTPWGFFLSLLFIALSIKSKRHFPLLFISTLPLIADFIYRDFCLNTKKIMLDDKKNIKINLFLKSFIVICFLSVIASSIVYIDFRRDPFKGFCNEYPCDAVNFLKENPQNLDYNIFNFYSWGGFMIHEYSEKKLFIDGRLPQKELNNHSYIEEYLEFYNLEDNELEEKIRNYDIKLFLLNKDKPVKLRFLDKKVFRLEEDDFKSENKLINFLEENDNWEKIYEDDISLIYKKQ